MKFGVVVCVVLALGLCVVCGPAPVSGNIFTDIADAIRRGSSTVGDYKRWISDKWDDLRDMQRMIRFIEYIRPRILAIQDNVLDVANQINALREDNAGVCDLDPVRVKARVLMASIDDFELPELPYPYQPVFGYVSIGGHSQDNCTDKNGGHTYGAGDVITISDCPTDGATCTQGVYNPVLDGPPSPIYALCSNATYGIWYGPSVGPINLFSYDFVLFTDASCSNQFWPAVPGAVIATADIRISATGRQSRVCTAAKSVPGDTPARIVTFDTDFDPSSAPSIATPATWTALILACATLATSSIFSS